MRQIVTGILLAALAAAQASADTCWRRTYTDGHMASQPNQTVRVLQVRLPGAQGSTETQYGDRIAEAWVVFRDSNRVYTTGLFCWDPEPGAPRGAVMCGVECDGGSFMAWPKGDGQILLRTRGGFIVDGGCGENAPIRRVTDRGAAQTTFKLYRVDMDECR